MTGTRDETVAPAADEDGFVFPTAWRRLMFPRRGGVAGPALTPGTAGAEDLVSAAKAVIELRLEHPASDPELVAAARAHLADPATGGELGAAVVAGLVACDVGWGKADQLAWIADGWVAQRGVVFAAAAAVQVAGLEFGGYWNNGAQVEPRVVRRTGRGWGYFPHWLALGGRVRAYLAGASDTSYAEAVAALTKLREHSAQWRAAASFLVPTQTSWVDGDCAAVGSGGDQYQGQLLWCSASTAEQLALVAPAVGGYWGGRDTAAIATAADGAGPAIAASLLGWLDTVDSADVHQRLVGVLAQLPTDEAFGGLVARLDRKYVPLATMEAARRYPRRALRLLAADGRAAARDMLRVHVLSHQDVAVAALENLPAASRTRVEAVLVEASNTPVASSERLPAWLVTPAWTVKKKAVRPTVLAGREFTEPAQIVWAAGEQEEWGARRSMYAQWWKLDVSLDQAIAQHRAGRLAGHHQVTLMATGPQDVVAAMLPVWEPARIWDSSEWMPPLIARYGLAALPPTLRMARQQPATSGGLLLPFADGDVAAFMADALVRLKSLRPVALSWFDRHAAYAARALMPAALGKPGPARRAAEEALRIVAGHHRADVLAAADGYGPQARAGIDSLLGADPLASVPARVAALPLWAEPALLPRILLADRSAALGNDVAAHLCTMLAISKPGDVYAGVPLIRELCDRRSLAEFAWALFAQWQAVGAPAKEGWPLQALRWIGDDDTVRRLSPVIRAWPGEGGHAKAITGLDVLADIGSDLALMHLHGIAQKAKFKGLKDRANEKVAEVAAGLGLTAEQLGDRLVPDFGLDSAGSLRLDYGPRQFVVGFDEQLKPFVADEAGARRKDLPKPGARDDQELAPAAYQRFAALKKDVRTVAADQIRRLEASMVARRTWPADEFEQYFVGHPLLWHIVRRLVWTATVDGGDPAAFRVAEDRTYADRDDDAYALPAGATVALAHPLHLGGDLAAWSEVFADYEILQPFAQLGRATYALTDEEGQATDLTRFASLTIPTTTMLGLERRGWRRGEPQDAGIQGWMWRATPDDRAIVVDLDPGIPIGALDIFDDQKITSIWINNAPTGTWRPQKPRTTFGSLDAVTASEMLRDLTEVLAR